MLVDGWREPHESIDMDIHGTLTGPTAPSFFSYRTYTKPASNYVCRDHVQQPFPRYVSSISVDPSDGRVLKSRFLSSLVTHLHQHGVKVNRTALHRALHRRGSMHAGQYRDMTIERIGLDQINNKASDVMCP